MKTRLDQKLVQNGLVSTRSQAESYVKLGEVTVNQKVITKPGFLTSDTDQVMLNVKEQYVSRAALKLASVAEALKLDFINKTVLDVGSSTGGFTDYALQHGAKKVIAVDVGSDQLHPSLRENPHIELHEKTDIRDFEVSEPIDLIVIDVSFISLREILPAVAKLSSKRTLVAAMVKPQFEAGREKLKHKGVIKNDRLRREILKNFEQWAGQHFVVLSKADSDIKGAKGNQERFYLLTLLS
ncbi:MAG TPA: TlyA family RNA methyltransferase [Verrucomicrobiae bacterium]|nr:TlyA family RNA methyltransferase [Verrucomicrobiae bacterium]